MRAQMRALTWGHMHRFHTQNRLDVTVGGHETRNEMCLNYLIYYPKINLGSCFAKADWEGTIKSFAKLLVPRRPLPFADRPGSRNTLAWQVQNEGASADQMEAAWNNVSDQLVGQNLWNTKAEGALKTHFPSVRKSCVSACLRALSCISSLHHRTLTLVLICPLCPSTGIA